MPILDVYSRYCLSCYSVDRKDAEEILSAFTTTTRKYGYPKYFWTEQGKEFTNKLMQEYYKKHDIKLYHTYGEGKAAIAERFNLTLRTAIYKSTALYGKFSIEDIVKKYNNKVHSTIGQTPYDVYIQNKEVMLKKSSNKPETPIAYPGDRVRILLKRDGFDKKSKHNWSEEVYEINSILEKDNIVGYYLDGINGVFYKNEIMKTNL